MRHLLTFIFALTLMLGLGACTDDSSSDDGQLAAAQCADGDDNDSDSLIDFPADPGCSSPTDNSETDPPPPPACADGLDNDSDSKIDFPNDPGCASATDADETNPATPPVCADGADNDGDGKIDHPLDPGCASAADSDEADPPACGDGVDNDSDGKTDFPADPGCIDAADASETDPVTLPACGDGADNDGDGKTDFPNDPGCDSAADTGETDPATLPACANGTDNDGDGLTDYPADPGCESAADTDEFNLPLPVTRTRYGMNNQCWALRSNGNGNYVVRNASGYAATATALANAEPFYLKPSALGSYLLYNRNRQLMTVGTAPAVGHVASASATDNAEWMLVGVGDATAYPPTPEYNREPTAAEISAYRGFAEPNLPFSKFTLRSMASNTRLAVNGSGTIIAAVPAADAASESFSFVRTSGCLNFPEANSDFSGVPFSGTQPDGTVLGHADVHVHISATEFLGGAQWGSPYHKFGVEHALGNCSEAHGDSGQLDAVGGLFSSDVDGHDTTGWPGFPEWPARNQLTHEAIYWKWLERSWAAGLRVAVNDLVDNATLCELQRNVSGDPTRDCNEMNNAGQQAGSMYGMQDYIDAQYGGRGAGFFQIVHDAAEARDVIEDGKMAVVLGIEISNLFNCQLNYSPLRMRPPETEDGSGGIENSYACTTVEGLPNSILTQMQRIYGWGVRQIISIHEFDNAFGGNGIFDGMILNLGNRENSGGIPLGAITGPFEPDLESPTGEFWTTYDCPVEGSTPGFSGYLWGNSGGSTQDFLSPPLCIAAGQGGRAGGVTPCYPSEVRQCNARWMTPAGLYTYGKMMEMGFLFDWDHMEMGMKTQALELAEAQTPVYPFVSTHGTFGGTTVDQATRMLRNGGFLYPSNGSSRGFRSNMDETRTIHAAAMEGLPEPLLFGFGYGTDTNGLSAQTGPRDGNGVGGQPFKPIVYPFSLFAGAPFDTLPAFDGAAGVVFSQPSSTDADGSLVRTWHQDLDGNAHHGMLSDFVQEIRLEGTAQDITDLFNSAEAYLQTWERTEASSIGIKTGGLKTPAAPVLRPAPPVGDPVP